MTQASSTYSLTGSEIAVIGMTCRFPGAADIEAFWRNLRDGVESIRHFSVDELTRARVDPQLFGRDDYVKSYGYLADIELFDASFFGFTPREAEIMDVQHRLFLECAWCALEQSGYVAETYEGAIGVFGSAGINTYLLNNLLPNRSLIETVGGYQLMICNDKDYLATRVAHRLNLRGPSVSVQTACSSSLVAIHMACQSLLGGESNMVLAGGVSIQVPQTTGYLYQKDMILSADGHCRAFDKSATGTVGGSGVGIVLLKRYEEALQDGDTIHAIIKGSAVNNDGNRKVGYSAPSVEGQQAVISEALAVAGVTPETITYVECHGTGTSLGDPIEVAALAKALQANVKRESAVVIGSVKTNVGHLDTAAGVAGLIKTVLALKNQTIPPSLHFKQPNPEIDFERTPFRVQASLTPWNSPGPRRAGVSSFGIGGTNAHVVLEEAPIPAPASPGRPRQVLILSAKTQSALAQMSKNVADFFADHADDADTAFPDVAYTLGVGRQEHSYRMSFVAGDAAEATRLLRSQDPRRIQRDYQEFRRRAVVFMFSGQGAQYAGMAAGLYATEPLFREQLDYCAETLRPSLGIDLRDVLYPADGSAIDSDVKRINDTAFAQPALFAVEYALARQWMDWGIKPVALLGHSLGEYVAACLAGVFSLPDALRLVAERGKMVARLPRGSMLAVPLSEEHVQPLLNHEIALAAVNAPAACVVAGETEVIDKLSKRLADKGVQCLRLATSHAFHSHLMDPITEDLRSLVGELKLSSPNIPYLSNLTGTWITADQATDPTYWARHLRETVKFAKCAAELPLEKKQVLLEVGPGRSLATLVKAQLQKVQDEAGQLVYTSLPTAREAHTDHEHLLATLGRLWLAGVNVDWPAFYQHQRRRRIPLPTYPFQRQRYWIDPPADPTQRLATSNSAGNRSAVESDPSHWFYIPSWRRTMLPIAHRDHPLTWLVFLNRVDSLGTELVKNLRGAGDNVVSVTAGERYEKSGESEYVINSREAADYQSLLHDMRDANWLPDKIVHLWNVDPEQAADELIDAAQDTAFFSLLHLAQAVGPVDFGKTVDVAVVSTNMQNVAGEATLSSAKAMLLGPVRVMAKEYPNITCRSIDIVDASSFSRASLSRCDQLEAELRATSADKIVALRDGHRWTECFEQVQLPSAKPPHLPGDNRNHGSARPWTREGVYLITGGLGGIGLVFAEYLAKTWHARLVLTSRTPLPARYEWVDLSTTSATAAVRQTIAKLQELQCTGAQIVVARADAANADEMQAVLADTIERFGRIDGVIHAAGVAGGGLMQLKTREVAGQVLRPKVQGTLVLADLTRDIPLDFFAVFSSVTSVVGDVGQVDYCAANAFLDALANQLRRRGVPMVSLGWDTWRDVGMAVKAQAPRELKAVFAEAIGSGITAEEGITLFERALASGLAHVIVSKTELPARIETAPKLEDMHGLQLSPARHARPELSRDYVAPRNETESALAGVWQELLGIERVGVHDDFFELGGHSLLAIQLLSRVREVFAVTLSIATLFANPTICEFAEQLSTDSLEGVSEQEIDEILAELDALSDDEAQQQFVLSEMYSITTSDKNE